jgi:hypothetical protein
VNGGKKNCWEFCECGRQLGGANAYEMGVCPASTYIWFDGIHGGKNAGRTCWIIGGTMCGGNMQGTFNEKFKLCGGCNFYNSVKAEEGGEMIPSVLLLEKTEENN